MIRKPVFQTIALGLLLGTIGLTAYWGVTYTGLWPTMAELFMDDEGMYDILPAAGLTWLPMFALWVPVVLVLRRFSDMPTLEQQLSEDKSLESLFGSVRPAAAIDEALIADRWRRAVAFVIDRGLAIVIILLGVAPTIALQEAYDIGPALSFVTAVPFVGAGAFYAWCRDAFKGQSLGRRVLKLRVVRVDTLEPIGAGRSFLRELMLHFAPILAIELVMIFVRPDGTRLGDLLAKTVVVNDKAREAYAQRNLSP